MAAHRTREIDVVLDEDRLHRRGFQIDEARVRLIEKSDDLDDEPECEVRWSVRGRFDPRRWTERYQPDFSPPALVPLLHVPALGDQWFCQYLSEFSDHSSGRIRIGARQELHGVGRCVDAEGTRALLTAFDSADVDVRPVPLKVAADPVRVTTELEPAACGCTMAVSVAHASSRRDETQEETYLQLYALGSMRPCDRPDGDESHEFPTVTLEIEDDSGFILESRQVVTLYGDDETEPPRIPAEWLFATTISLDEFSEPPEHVLFRSP